MASVLHPHRRPLDAELDDEITAADPKATGCCYAPRCPLATGLCLEKAPSLARTEENQYVACHRV